VKLHGDDPLDLRPKGTRPDVILDALDLGLQVWRTTPSRERFTDAVAELGWMRERNERLTAALQMCKRMAERGVGPDTSAEEVLTTIARYIEKRLNR
jgi:hypothetical protein